MECLIFMISDGEKIFRENAELENMLENELISILD
jgi:hypothetical protein